MKTESSMNMSFRVLLTLFFLVFALPSQAQFWKKKKKTQERVRTEQPSSVNPGRSPEREQDYASRASKKEKRGPTYNLEQEFYERMERVVKERRKAEKIMKKPQYSDPMYFGHKRPPKKRPPHKMKFCKECGIRH